MPEKWTGEIIADMHTHGIPAKRLAEKMGVHEKYLSALLNSKRKPKDAEQRCRSALDELLKEAE